MNAAVERADVVILGGGLAGLTLARHLLLETDREVTVLDRRVVGPSCPKYGESSVQLAGYYYGKVLDLEELLMREHYLKYNLRFYWAPDGRGQGAGPAGEHGSPARFEDYAQSYLRAFSNIVSYQIDRNRFEEAVRERNRANPRYRHEAPIDRLAVALSRGEEAHRVSFHGPDGPRELAADWVIDATGRSRFLARKYGLATPSPIRHGAAFLWVEGLVDVEKLTDRPAAELRRGPQRRAVGQAPLWLATNHFCRDGLWFWVIPLHGVTSLGVVFDHDVMSLDEVSTAPRMLDWVRRNFPCFTDDLSRRRVVGHSGLRDYAHDGRQVFSADRWAMTGEAARFSDPLYSPGSDLISLHNTFIVDLVKTASRGRREVRTRQHEVLARALYEAYLPGYTIGYRTLGDQEAFSLKYAWELEVYFAFYVFPFINQLFTADGFVAGFLRRFERLGPVHRGLQELLAGFARWKASPAGRGATREGVCFEFSKLAGLARSQELFYEVDGDVEGAFSLLDEHLGHALELARFIAAHVAAVVLGEPDAIHDRAFVESIDLDQLTFDEADMRLRLDAARRAAPPEARRESYRWSFDSTVLDVFRPAPVAAGAVM